MLRIDRVIWLGLVLLALLAGCASTNITYTASHPAETPQVTTQPGQVLPTWTAAPPAPQPTATQAAPVSGGEVQEGAPASAKAAPLNITWDKVSIPEAGLNLEAPSGWPRRGNEWAWSRPDTRGQLVAVNWNSRAPGWEPTSMLPNHSVSLDARSLPEITWGTAMLHTVEVYDSAAGGGKLAAVEQHLIVLTDKRAFDFSISAPTVAALQVLKPLNLHMADTARTQN